MKMAKKKKTKEETHIFAKIKIEKVSLVTPTEFGAERKDLRFIAIITNKGDWEISFSEKTLPKLFNEMKKEVY